MPSRAARSGPAPRSSRTGTHRTPSSSVAPLGRSQPPGPPWNQWHDHASKPLAALAPPREPGMSALGHLGAGTATTVPPPSTEPVAGGRRRRALPYLLLLPGLLWLTVFFVLPLVSLFFTSLYDPAGS